MKKGILKRIDNCWFVRTKESVELDDVHFVDYSLSLSSFSPKKLKEGEKINFNLVTEDYTDLEGLGQNNVTFAVYERV